MGTSRIQKFKEYRNSLIKEGSAVIEEEKSQDNHSQFETTSTLPMDQVIEALEEDHDDVDYVKKARRRTILKYVLIGLGLALVIAGIIVFAVLVFK